MWFSLCCSFTANESVETYPVSPHDSLFPSVLLVHLSDHVLQPFRRCRLIRLHPDLAPHEARQILSIVLKFRAAHLEHLDRTRQYSLNSTSHRACQHDLRDREVGERGDDSASVVVGREKERVDTCDTDQRTRHTYAPHTRGSAQEVDQIEDREIGSNLCTKQRSPPS